MKELDAQTLVRWGVLQAQLRKRRLDNGWTQAEISARMGRSHDFVANLENGTKHTPMLVTVWMWVAALGGDLTVDWDGSEEADTLVPDS